MRVPGPGIVSALLVTVLLGVDSCLILWYIISVPTNGGTITLARRLEMRTTLKKKAKLRKLIKNSIGNTGSLDCVEFYDDWTWADMSSSTRSGSYVMRSSIGDLAVNNYDTYYGDENIDINISDNFNEIEERIRHENNY